MKKFSLLNIVVLIILASTFLFSCGKKNAVQNNANADANAIEMKKFVVGFDAEYPPFGYLSEDGKTYEGFDLDLAREVCKRTNMEFVARPIDWDSKDMELNSESIDCIWSGFTINGRENDYTWTVPYVDNSIVLIVNADANIKTKADLAGKTVMVQAGSSGLAALTDEENADNVAFVKSLKNLEQCADYNSAFMNLESGMVDCVVVDIGVAKFNLEKSNGKFIQLEENVSSEQYGIGFKKGNVELKDKVEKALFDMYKDKTFMNIANKYQSYSLPDTVCIGNYVK